MGIIEILLTPIYILLFYLIFKIRSKRLPEAYLKKYYIRGFWVKMLGCILFVIYYTYLTGGDTRSVYYQEGYNFYKLLLKDSNNWKYVFMQGADFNPSLVAVPFNFGYYRSDANFMIIRLTALLSFLSFGYYTIISLFFALFAYSGLWKLFLFFYERRPWIHKGLALSILFFPSVVFWSSGLLKDSITIGALGWLTYSLGQFLKGRRLIRNGLMLFISVYLLAVVKVYILLAYAPFLMLFLFISKLKIVKAKFLKYFLTIATIIGIVFVFSQTYSSFEEELGAYAVENLTNTAENISQVLESENYIGGSTFNLGAQFDGSFVGLIKVAPFAIIATFYRPFIWETGKISQLLAAVESMILLFFTLKLLFRAGFFRVVRYVLSDPMIIYCLLFALVFGIFMGAATPNFGSLVRYKIPCMPFYAISLFLLYHKEKERRAAKQSLASP